MNKIILIIVTVAVLGFIGLRTFNTDSINDSTTGTNSTDTAGTDNTAYVGTTTNTTGTSTKYYPPRIINTVGAMTPPEIQRQFTMAEIAENKDASSCWTVVRNTVYNLTSFINEHPGGREKYSKTLWQRWH